MLGMLQLLRKVLPLEVLLLEVLLQEASVKVPLQLPLPVSL